MSSTGPRRPAMKQIPAERIPAFNRLLGIDRVRAGGGRAEITLDLLEQHTNRRGVAHGGLVSALLDTALGSAVVSAIRPEEWCGTVQLSVQFREPGTGPRLTGHGRMVRRGRGIAFAEGEIVDDRGRTVASAQGTWHIWPSRPGARDTSKS